MRVEGQRLRPGVEDGNGAGKHSEMLTTDVMKRFQCSRKEQCKGHATFGEEEAVERRGHGEDHVKVRDGQEVAHLSFHPSCLIQALTLWAMAISARVVERDLATAVVAHLEVATEGSGPAVDDVADHATALRPQSLQRRGVGSENLG
jgi:hypothetical protein